MSIVTRPGQESDYPYVIDSFLHGFRQEPWSQGCDNDFLTGLMKRMLYNYEKWHLTCLIEDSVPSEILGYVVWKSPQDIAWLCIKRVVHGQGLSRKLLEAVGCDTKRDVNCAFITAKAMKKSGSLRFRPYLAYQ